LKSKATRPKTGLSGGVFAFTDRITVKLDLDKTPFRRTVAIAKRSCRWLRLDGFIILKSSPSNYHAVFNEPVTWERNVRCMAWVCCCAKFPVDLCRWVLMQCIKRSSTLRTRCKEEKQPPRIVFGYGHQDMMIAYYLKNRVFHRKIERCFY
jgi:hypothetical protein